MHVLGTPPAFVLSQDQTLNKNTGAPVETMPFEEVEYWKELTEIMDWTKNARSFHAAHLLGSAGRSYYHYGIPKYMLPEKMSGIFKHHVLRPKEPLLRGFDDIFCDRTRATPRCVPPTSAKTSV